MLSYRQALSQLSHSCNSFFQIVLFFELGSHYVSLAILELTDPCLCLLSAGIKQVHQYVQLLCFKINSKSIILLHLIIAMLSKASSGTNTSPPLNFEALSSVWLGRMPTDPKTNCACAQGPTSPCDLLGHSLQVAAK